MALARFMVRNVEHAPAVFVTDRYGNQQRQAPVWSATARPIWLGRNSASETLGERSSGLESEWLAFSDDVQWPIVAADQLRLDGQIYEVDGSPHVAWTPHGAHHLEIPLRLVEG